MRYRVMLRKPGSSYERISIERQIRWLPFLWLRVRSWYTDIEIPTWPTVESEIEKDLRKMARKSVSDFEARYYEASLGSDGAPRIRNVESTT